MEPRIGGPAGGAGIPPVDYLDWYIPRLSENRPHDLSQSGYAHPWDIEADADWMLNFWSKGVNPAGWIADRHGVSTDRVCVAHGVSQALTMAILAALPEHGARTIGVEMPSFGPVTQCARLLGCEVIPFERDMDTGEFDRDAVLEIIGQVSVIVLTPMLNPTGHMLSRGDQDWLAMATHTEGVNVVSDEVYLDAARGTEFYRPMYMSGAHIISVNSLTKCYGLGSLRFGWLIGDAKLIANAQNAMYNLQGETSGPSMALARIAFPRLDEALERLNAHRTANLPRLRKVLEAHDINWNEPPTGIFGLIPIGTDSVRAMARHGAPLGLLATPGSMFHADLSDYLRIAWGGEPAAFQAAMPVLSRFLTRLEEERDTRSA